MQNSIFRWIAGGVEIMGLTGSILRKSEILSFKETKTITIEILESLKYMVDIMEEYVRTRTNSLK